jgi:hypothetical protein
MFSPSRWGAIAGYSVLALALVIDGCSDGAHKTAENAAGSAASSSTAAAGAFAGEPSEEGGAQANVGGAPAVDDSSYAGAGNGECRPGQTRCNGQLGFQRCAPDGVWGATQSCGGYSENGTSSYCALFDMGDELPWAACVDPACAWWHQSGLDTGEQHPGVCLGEDQIRPCIAGILRRAEPCGGVCRRVGELDGRVLGYCDAGCDEGARECLGGALYRICENGRWSTAARACADGAECLPLAHSAYPDIKCGGACEPSTSRCSADGSGISMCSEGGEWEAQPPCVLGHCVQAGATAQCQTECKPGEHACAFDGSGDERVCGDTGLWGELTACGAGTTCRVGTAGALGCLACVGSSLAGGNAWGVADSRCDESGLAQCGADNVFEAGSPCAKDQTCTELTRGAGTLGYCE